MGLTMQAFYGGGAPPGSPVPASINVSHDPLNDKRLSPAYFWVGIIVALAAIRLLYEYGTEV